MLLIGTVQCDAQNTKHWQLVIAMFGISYALFI